MDYKAKYDELLKAVESRMLDYLKECKPDSLYEPFRYIVSGGGKRIRPVLTMIACGAMGADPLNALNAGAAIEIMHNFTLAHDDIMDQSPMRRGRDTVHIKWNEAVAIITGDVMVGHGYKLLPKPSQHVRSEEIMDAYTRGLIEVCEGQAYDMDFNEMKDVSIDDYYLMIEKKTSLLLETSALMGAHTGLGEKSEIEAIRIYANELGKAFQLQDDLLDLSGDEEVFGKTVGLDIQEGKKTWMIIKTRSILEEMDSPAKEDIDLMNKFYAENGLKIDQAPKMLALMEKLGVLDQAREQIKIHYDKAIDQLENLQKNEYTEMLNWLIKKLSSRVY